MRIAKFYFRESEVVAYKRATVRGLEDMGGGDRMLTTYKLNLDFWKPCPHSSITAMQNDVTTRAMVLSLFENGQPWQIPEGVHVVTRYEKADGHGGVYDSYPDGTVAWSAEGNTVTVGLVPQMLTVPGAVKVSIDLILGERVLHTFPVFLHVHEGMLSSQEESGDYNKVRGFVPLPRDASLGQMLVVSALTPAGTVAEVEGRDVFALVQETGTDESAVMSQKAVTEALMKVSQIGPLFVNGVEECIDQSAIYVLPDGYLYAYMYIDAPSYTNLAQVEDADWLQDSRLNSSGAVTTQTGTLVTRYFPIADGDVIRIKGLDVSHISTGGVANSWRYSSTKAVQGASVNVSTMISNGYASLDGDVFTIPAGRSNTNAWQSNVAYQRFTGTLMDGYTLEDVVVTINEEIIAGKQWAWVNTGHAFVPSDYEDRVLALEAAAEKAKVETAALRSAVETMEDSSLSYIIPEYWMDHLEEKTEIVQQLQEAGGKDCFSFAVIADIHESTNLGKCSGALAKYMLERCDMKYVLGLGDMATRESVSTCQTMESSLARAEAILKPVRNCLLRTRGNHDGCWDDDGTNYYIREFTPQKLHSLIWRKSGMVPGVVSDETGTAYYVDDPANRVRYILLNCHYAPYEENEDGSSKYSSFRNARFGQAQYNWLVKNGLDVPAGWGIILGTHVPLNDSYTGSYGGTTGDCVLMRNLLAAYNGRRMFQGSFAGTMGWDAVDISADFTCAAGEVIAVVAGHSHTDTEGIWGIPVITTRCDAAEENDLEQKKERKAGTITEQSFDVFTVDRGARTIHITKIGAGSNRRIQY